ncbi:ABC transporter permease [Aerococcaceae bacterium zg-B36]|uniref:ABC transporter permease n=1 Tax=Aerococcaceae bacterium zg-252 TaxID=2796928 RepID=UPI001BD80E96|nr:ABC transporter permease [Aerococcaceae bacterium zg-B36]
MSIVEIMKFHIRRIITTPSIIGMLLVMPLGVVLIMSFVISSGSTNVVTNEKVTEPSENVATVVLLEENNQVLKQALIDADFGANIWEDKEKAEQYLAQGKVGVIYTVPEDYLMNPQPVKVQVRNQQGRSNAFEQTLHQIVYRQQLNHALENNQLKTNEVNKSIDKEELVVIEAKKGQSLSDFVNAGVLIMLIVVYIMLAGNTIGADLVGMGASNVLRRLITTPNSSWKIIGTILFSYALVLLVINSLIIGCISWKFHISTTLLLRSIWIVILAIIFNLSYAIAMFRIFKNPNAASNIGMLGFIVLNGLGFIDKIVSIQWVKNLSYLSPLKWMMMILDSGNWFVGTVIILLLSLVLFTAGTYKLEHYVKRA